jgi:conjugal transfer mating pair stabilization protein TraN
MQCSPNPCFDPTAPGNQQTTAQNDAMLQNDGPKDASGNCLGQLYIFNGKPSRCRPPGLKVGMINNCCDSAETSSEDMGTSIQTAVGAIQTAYEIGQVAYYGNALVTGAAQIASISTSATGAVTSMTVVTATGSTATLSGASAAGAYGALASGTTGASAMTAGIEAYASALLNPTTIIVAVVVIVVMKVLFGNGCDEKDLQTGSQVAGKDCHYVGDYCELKWPLAGCVQKAKSYCCFNSKMARIIHEQGRPQLQAFQPNGGWGVPELPNCRVFTPEEFQGLDFSRIDLSEYFADLQKDLAGKIQGSQATIMQNIQNRYQAVK